MAYINWDPSRELFQFNIPFLNRPILWYGFLFALGFFLAYWVFVYLLERYLACHIAGPLKKKTRELADQVTLYVIMGTLIGARLGDLLFYQDWHSFKEDPYFIFKIWNGGLASHGGAIGILVAFMILIRSVRKKYHFLSMSSLLDLAVIPTTLAAVCIRIGNFMNQEILGTPTTLPWAVIFGHPLDGSRSIPRHPVQIYEAIVYLLIFCVLLMVWQKDCALKRKGRLGGLFLILVFSARFFLEFLKEEQSIYISVIPDLTMGQILSVPFVIFGFYLFFHRKN